MDLVAVKGLPVHSFNALSFPILGIAFTIVFHRSLKLASFRYLLKVIIKPMFVPRCITVVCLISVGKQLSVWLSASDVSIRV